MKIMEKIEEIRKDLKQILIQTTRTNGRVSNLEKYRDEKLEPLVSEYWLNKGVAKEKNRGIVWRRFLIGTFAVALLVAVWNGGYWAFKQSSEEIAEAIVERAIIEAFDTLELDFYED